MSWPRSFRIRVVGAGVCLILASTLIPIAAGWCVSYLLGESAFGGRRTTTETLGVLLLMQFVVVGVITEPASRTRLRV